MANQRKLMDAGAEPASSTICIFDLNVYWGPFYFRMHVILGA